MSAARVVEAIARGSQVAGPTALPAIFGVAQVISEQVQRVKVNRRLLAALSRRVDEFVEALAQGFQSAAEQANEAWIQAFEDFEATLIQIREFLDDLGRKSYIVQFLQQQASSEQIAAMQGRLEDSIQVLMLQAGIMTATSLLSLNERLASFPVLGDIDMTRAAQAEESEQCSLRPLTLPACPDIHFGRASELRLLLDQVLCASSLPRARIALLGTGGIGKTSLALLLVHHPSIVDAFLDRRFFVACDAAESEGNLSAVVAASLGLTEGSSKALDKSLVRFLHSKPSLIILDNFESAWEPAGQRAAADSMLELLSSIDNLTLMITMRGSERPGSVQWTRPFLQPLEPLDGDAALQVFLSISEASEPDPALRKLVSNLDNLPLAVTLMANLARYESPYALLQRWEAEQTSMLSITGRISRASSLDASIQISLYSPRMLQISGARDMLSLIAVLPDGVVEADFPLFTSHIRDNLRCMSVLLQNTLVYRTTMSPPRIRVLAPIRAYMLAQHPAAPDLINPLYTYYYEMADTLRSAALTKTPEVIATVGPELGNMDAVIRHALEHALDPRPAITATVHMSEVLHNSGMWTHRDSTLLPKALEMARARHWQDLVADCLTWAGARAYGNAGRWTARQVLEEAVSIYKSLGNIQGELDAGLACARVHDTDDGELAEAHAILALAEQHGDDKRAVRAMLIISANFRQRPVGAVYRDQAREWLARALARMERMPAPDARTLRTVRLRLADLAYKSGDIQQALRDMEAVAEDTARAGQVTESAQARRTIGHILLMQGHAHKAIPYLEKAVLTYHSTGNMMLESWCSTFLGDAHLALGNTAEANRRYAAATQLADEVGPQWVWGRGDALLNQARLALHLGDTESALSHAQSARRMSRGARYLDDEARAVHLEGEIALAMEDRFAAVRSFVLAAVINLRCLERIQLFMNLTALADALESLGETDAGCRLGEAVLPSLYRAGMRRWTARALLCMAKCSSRQSAEMYARRSRHHFQSCGLSASPLIPECPVA